MQARGIKGPGHNVVLYWASKSARLDSAQGIGVDIGADVTTPFESDDNLRCVEPPSGRALHMKHVGPVQELGETYSALAGFARTNGLDISGPFWEVYGHWTADESTFEIDVFHLIGP